MERVREALEAAFSASGEARKGGEALLASLEPQPGFLSALAEVALNLAQAPERVSGVQELAGITLKHAIGRVWRKAGQEERQQVRTALLEQIERVANDRVAVQLSLGLARIARSDFPDTWPELFPTLTGKLARNNEACVASARAGEPAAAALAPHTRLKRNLYVLHYVLKELAGKRLPAQRKAFQELAQPLMPIVWSLVYRASEEVDKTLGAAAPSHASAEAATLAVLLSQVWQLCLKCLKRLLVSGFAPDAKLYQPHAQFVDILPPMLNILKLIHQKHCAGPAQQHSPLVLRAMLKILKLFRDMVEVHPWSFSQDQIMGPALEYLYFNITSTGNSRCGQQGGPGEAAPPPSLFVEEICMCSMSVVQSVTRSAAYRSAAPRGEAEQAARDVVGAAQKLLGAFFSPERLDSMICAAISSHMVLKQRDLEHWQESPEEFHHENDLGNFNETLRSGGEKLLCTFLETFKEQTVSTLMKLLQQVQGMPPGAEIRFDQLVLKESLYNAMCLAAYDLHDFVDFKAFFASQLMRDLALQKDENRIILRRVAYLLGAWVADVPNDTRQQVYVPLSIPPPLPPPPPLSHLGYDVSLTEESGKKGRNDWKKRQSFASVMLTVTVYSSSLCLCVWVCTVLCCDVLCCAV